jgi:hypothetical protein
MSVVSAFLKFVGFFVLFIGLMFLSTIFNAWVLVILWGWFVVPTFGLPVLTIVKAVGISLVVKFMTYKSTSSDDEDAGPWKKFLYACSLAIVYPLCALGVGYVVHLFM